MFVQNNTSHTSTGRQFLKAGPLAKRLNVTPKTIHRWHAEGHYSARKISPRVVLYDLAEVEAFIDSARVGTIKAAA